MSRSQFLETLREILKMGLSQLRTASFNGMGNRVPVEDAIAVHILEVLLYAVEAVM